MDTIKASRKIIRDLYDGLPEGVRSWRAVARLLDINSYHVIQLKKHKKLTPTMFRALVKKGHLDAPVEPVPTMPCWCGEVHPVDWCIYEEGPPIKPRPPSKKRERRPRFSAAADDPELAFRQLQRYYPGLFILKEI